MGLYAATDLHANNNFLAIIDETGHRVFQRRLPNDAAVVLEVLGHYRDDLVGAVVESTYNWYWLVDALMEAGYQVHLANTAAIQKYTGLKHVDDRHDAFWLAELLRLGILPERDTSTRRKNDRCGICSGNVGIWCGCERPLL